MNAWPEPVQQRAAEQDRDPARPGVHVDLVDVGALDVGRVEHQLARLRRRRVTRTPCSSSRPRTTSTSRMRGTSYSRLRPWPSSAATIALETRFFAPRTRTSPRSGVSPWTTQHVAPARRSVNETSAIARWCAGADCDAAIESPATSIDDRRSRLAAGSIAHDVSTVARVTRDTCRFDASVDVPRRDRRRRTATAWSAQATAGRASGRARPGRSGRPRGRP